LVESVQKTKPQAGSRCECDTRVAMEPRTRAATRIQASWKGHVVRRELVHSVRRDFEETVRRLEGPLALREANVVEPSRVGWKTHVSRPILSSPDVENDDSRGVISAGRRAVANQTTAPVNAHDNPEDALDAATRRRLDGLRRELAWAQDALEDRRQHLRRLRRDEARFDGNAPHPGVA